MDTRSDRPRCPDPESVQKWIDYTCPKKLAWRQHCIIDTYCQLTGRESVPANKQYWTMPNKILDRSYRTPRLLKNCEFDQIIKAGLVKPNQCHGVEVFESIYNDNARVKKVHSYLGDFLDVMDHQAYLNNYRPAIIDYDSIEYPETREEYFPRILYTVTKLGIKDVMVIWNFVIKAAYHDLFDLNRINSVLSNSTSFSAAYWDSVNQKVPWTWSMYAEEYKGSGKGNQSTMATIIFYR